MVERPVARKPFPLRVAAVGGHRRVGEAAPSGRPVPPMAVGNALREVAGLTDG